MGLLNQQQRCSCCAGRLQSGGTVAAAHQLQLLLSAESQEALNWCCMKMLPWEMEVRPIIPWLQELPDPITKATWDNYAMVSPKFGREVLGIDLTKQRDADEYEVHT